MALFRVKRYDRNKMTQIRHLAIHSIVKPPEQRIGFSLYFLIVVAQIGQSHDFSRAYSLFVARVASFAPEREAQGRR